MNHRFYFLGLFFGVGIGITAVTCMSPVPLGLCIIGSAFCFLFDTAR